MYKEKRIFQVVVLAALVSNLLTLQSCSLNHGDSNRDGQGLKVILEPDLEAEKKNLLLSEFNLRSSLQSSRSLQSSQFLAPSTVTDFDCFFINVTGAGVGSQRQIPPNCIINDNLKGRGEGVTAPPGRRNQSFELDVTSGPARIIDVYGFHPALPECGNNSGVIRKAYHLGSKSIDLVDSTSVTIPISYSTTAAESMSCTGVNPNARPLTLTFGGEQPAGCATATGLPDTPTPTIGGYAAAYSGADITEASTDNGTMVVDECLDTSGAAKAHAVEYMFDVTGINLTEYTSVSVVWKGRAGRYTTGSCSASSGTGLTVGGAKVYIWKSNVSGTSSFIQIGSATIGSAAIETITGSLTMDLTTLPFTNNKIYIRIVGGSSGTVNDCSAIYTDFIGMTLN